MIVLNKRFSELSEVQGLQIVEFALRHLNQGGHFLFTELCFEQTSTHFSFISVKNVLINEFEDILTEEAFQELLVFLDKQYFSFSNPTHTVI